ncbi:hypothetical protein CONPUDRAFT_83703 [Coniophora puteana RWD-64-598 SS2]|uniref:Uncharacterized protein n=1 Tax=Coniophora puteana (strain RWD-64-598) TaxID=741705 RepID=A0A5M3MHU6_CONPW|nr:uncharacterized protein CONPUDRAFT_83703 [Coniophora puteana RWD-64-598 SS2]EIW78201.1 hypothetical protein CONPUDRAFT_83703 [Coniophora puteana RWD-64-598 SS2]
MFFVDDPVDPGFYDCPVLDALDDVPLRGLSTSPPPLSPESFFPNDPVYLPSSTGAGAGTGGRHPRDACAPEGEGSGSAATTDTLPTPGLAAVAPQTKKVDGRYFGRDAPVSSLGPTGAGVAPARFIFYPVEWEGSLAHSYPPQRSQNHRQSGQLHARRPHQPRSYLYPISVLEEMTALISKLPVPGTPFIPEPGPLSNDTYEYLPPTQPTDNDKILPPASSSVWQDIERWRSTVPENTTTLPPPPLDSSTLPTSMPEFPYIPPPLQTTGTPFIPPLPSEGDPYIPPLLSEDAPYIPPTSDEPLDSYIPLLPLHILDDPSLRPPSPGTPYIPPLPFSPSTGGGGGGGAAPGLFVETNTVPLPADTPVLGRSPFDTRGRKRLREDCDLSPGRRHRDRSSREARDARWSRGDDAEGW